MKLWLPLLFSIIAFNAIAQEKPIEGIVFDKLSNERLARVNVLNIRTGKSVYNNLKGEFNIIGRYGDLFIFTKQGYFTDTVKIKNDVSIAVYLKAKGINLKEVTIHNTILTPEQRLETTKHEYSRIYGSLANRDILSFSPGGGAGISIDALYNSFSRSGRNAQKLQGIIEEDYKQNLIDYRFNKAFVSQVTGLKDQQLSDFMFRYRPGYYLVTTTSDYEFLVYIQNNLKRYLRNPHVIPLQPLVK